MYLKYKKRWTHAKSPRRGHPSDAGLDVFWCPEDSALSVKALESGESFLFDTGLSFEVPHGYMLQVMNRGSMGSKGLVVGAHCIDAGYEGNVFIDIHNISLDTHTIENGAKIAQLVMVPVMSFEPLEGDIYSRPVAISNRGDGALGSTN